ncbi:MAG: GTP-binding protein [Acidobacteria bacterium]|nr:GTP-binding protein [Acidobacteriota bacterium]
MVPMAPIGLLIVTGPLGAGKTTAVNHLLRRELAEGRRVAILVNEFGSVSVDGTLIGTARPELAGIENLVNGCVCCSLRGDVVKALDAWASGPPDSRPERIVIETTGLADPTDLVDLDLEPCLAGRVRIQGCLTLMSALAPLHHLQERSLLRRQAALASLVYVSKADLDPSSAVAWESQLRSQRPGVPIVHSRLGVPPPGSPDPWAGLAGAEVKEGPLPATPARAIALRFDHPIDPQALESFLAAPPPGELLRAKGICLFQGFPPRSDGGDRWAFQWADGRLEVTPLPFPPGGALQECVAVVIGLDLDPVPWRKALRGLERPPAGARRRRPRP